MNLSVEENQNEFPKKGVVDWKKWAGRNKFCCNGYCMTGLIKHDWISLLIAYLLNLIVPIYFWFYPGGYLYKEVSKALSFFLIPTFIFTYYNLLRCTFTDPGCIPRGNLSPVPSSESENSKASNIEKIPETKLIIGKTDQNHPAKPNLIENINNPDVISSKINLNDTENNNLNNVIPENKIDNQENQEKINTKKNEINPFDISFYRARYCSTCKIMRPPQASHCKYCDNCVKKFDHHCFFVGNCIGLRNQRNFTMFFLGIMIECFYCLILLMITYIKAQVCNYEKVTRFLKNDSKKAKFYCSFVFVLFALMLCMNKCCFKRSISAPLGYFVGIFGLGQLLWSVDYEVDWVYCLQGYIIATYLCLGFFTLGLALFIGNFSQLARGQSLKEVHALKMARVYDKSSKYKSKNTCKNGIIALCGKVESSEISG